MLFWIIQAFVYDFIWMKSKNERFLCELRKIWPIPVFDQKKKLSENTLHMDFDKKKSIEILKNA